MYVLRTVLCCSDVTPVSSLNRSNTQRRNAMCDRVLSSWPNQRAAFTIGHCPTAATVYQQQDGLSTLAFQQALLAMLATFFVMKWARDISVIYTYPSMYITLMARILVICTALMRGQTLKQCL